MADLGLDLYSLEPKYSQVEDCSEEQAVTPVLNQISEEPDADDCTNNLDDLPPLSDNAMQDPHACIPMKYAEDQEFSSLQNLSPLDKFFMCVSANASPRRIWICNQIPTLLKELDQADAFEYVFPLTLRLCQDEVFTVQEALVQNLDQILAFYFQGGSKIDPESLVQLLNCSLFSLSPNISTLSKISFLNFCQTTPSEILEADILPLLIELLLTHGEENSLNSDLHIQLDVIPVKIHIFEILRRIYSNFNQQTLIEVILPVLETHCSHHIFEIRREALFGIAELMNILPSSIVILRIYPLFVGLASDSIYEIRKFACDVYIKLAQHLIAAGKTEDAVVWMNSFINDNSQKVKIAAAGILGQVLYLFNNVEVPAELLKTYFTLCKSSRAEIRISCAFTFPAIVLLLKSDGWPVARASYLQLANDKEIGVLHTLSSSIHELAKILTPEQVYQDLLPVFYKNLKSTNAEVQKATLSIAGEFVYHIESSERPPLLEHLIDGFHKHLLNQNPARNWREKEILIRQLGVLLDTFDPWDSMVHILPLLLEIAKSRNVIQVRNWALDPLPSFYKIVSSEMCEDSSLLGGLFTQFDALLRSPSYRDRLIYVTICQKMLQDQTQALNFDTFFLPNLAALVVDPVTDVRLAVARLLNEAYNNSHDKESAQVPEVRHMLTRDLLARFRPEDHSDIQNIVDSLTMQIDALSLTS
ncbi:hypothetical protein DSO57_1036543 [Entomophthora muscae]|uniref:Uncharacterized protein n=1 Tax=Entomophthora muscae TaxID=34485 RepID=A0ACC2SCM3_9FUNG|nr:hypothetical protein DSO57_1036543 [Entomophthora muscae]